MIQRPPRSQFVEKVVVPVPPIDKEAGIKEALRKLHGDEK
jgi:hypothetical protein